MGNHGLIRKLDPLGRIVIPMEMRKMLSVCPGDDLLISREDNSVIISKYSNICIFCGNDRNVEVYKGVFICDDCMNKIKKCKEKRHSSKDNLEEV